MKTAPLRNDLFLYDLTIRILAFWATILFSLLFFTGAQANNESDANKAGLNKQVITHTYEIKSDKK